MVQGKRVDFDNTTQSIFIVFEDYKVADSVSEGSGYEILMDSDLLDMGLAKIVAIEVDIDRFNPSEAATEIPEQYLRFVMSIVNAYSGNQGSATRTA